MARLRQDRAPEGAHAWERDPKLLAAAKAYREAAEREHGNVPLDPSGEGVPDPRWWLARQIAGDMGSATEAAAERYEDARRAALLAR